MRQTLLRIPLDADWSFGFFQVPGLGFGLLLVLWVLMGGYWLYRNRAEIQAGRLLVPGLLWLLVAYGIVVIPGWVQKGPRSVIAAQTAVIGDQTKTRQSLEPLQIRGKAYEQVYEYENAAQDFQAMIDVAPDYDGGYLELAWLRATCPDPEIRDGEKALGLAQSALGTANVKTAIHFDTLAAAYAETGDFEKAILAEETAAKAAELSPDPAIRARLQDIRQRLEKYTHQQPHHEARFAQTFPQSLPIQGYGFMMFLAFLGAGLTASRLAARVGLASDLIWDLAIWTLLGGLVGARLFYIVQKRDQVFGGKSGMDLVWAPFQLQEGGLVLLGGVLLGSVVFIGYCFARKWKLLLMADIALPGFFVALAFGRLGCLMNGCCYGDR
ncbi:MAG: prolipoprotein diacylglyceryl transferase [Planctomycetaceae bacterium]|nr:prolipoprotein diacylglyceryl transferase [Planctomycetaceae bacterium]